MGGENARNNFSRNKPIERPKNVGKKSSKKCEKNVFYIHTNMVTKKGGKTRETIFPENQQIVRAKNVWKKIVAKNCEKTFFIFTRIS